MKLSFHTLDVFTSRRFCGNALAVVLDADDLTTEQMQKIAREFNLSETIFVRRPADPPNTASVRIFLPRAEIPFAGHPTVGCAILLAERKVKPGCSFETVIRLEAVAGVVPVKVSRIGEVSRAQFTAPVIPFRVDVPVPPQALAAQALGLAESDLGFDGHRTSVFEGGPRFLFVPVRSREALTRALAIEPQCSDMMEKTGATGVYLYTRGGDHPGTSYRARLYAPASGIPEDPATGSATAVLAAQLLASERLGDGTHSWSLEQGYEMGRPSDLDLEADIAGGKLIAARVAGNAVEVMRGTLET